MATRKKEHLLNAAKFIRQTKVNTIMVKGTVIGKCRHFQVEK